MLGNPLVAAEILYELGAAGWKRQSQMKVSLMD
jgi:hypothetical protein